MPGIFFFCSTQVFKLYPAGWLSYFIFISEIHADKLALAFLVVVCLHFRKRPLVIMPGLSCFDAIIHESISLGC